MNKDRIDIMVSAPFLKDDDVYQALRDAEVEGCDMWFGQSLYKGAIEESVRISVHETTFPRIFVLWRALRRNVPGVDCARVFQKDRDWCAKELYADMVRDGELL